MFITIYGLVTWALGYFWILRKRILFYSFFTEKIMCYPLNYPYWDLNFPSEVNLLHEYRLYCFIMNSLENVRIGHIIKQSNTKIFHLLKEAKQHILNAGNVEWINSNLIFFEDLGFSDRELWPGIISFSELFYKYLSLFLLFLKFYSVNSFFSYFVMVSGYFHRPSLYARSFLTWMFLK